MIRFLKKDNVAGILREIWPALVVLLGTLIISSFAERIGFLVVKKELWKILLRFFRFTFILVFPLPLLPWVFSIIRGILHRGNRQLIQIQGERAEMMGRLDSWFIRPFQGIGLLMLMAAKFLTFLQIYTGTTADSSLVLPSTQTQFSFGRFFVVTFLTIITSLLLSFLWSLDDLGIRHINRKTGEVRMIGKYLGVLLPVLFGFYGIINLFKAHELQAAVMYVAQMVMILYPSFVIFAMLHYHYIRGHERVLLKRLKVVPQKNKRYS
ncbi:MAG: hypothetical protein NTX36_13370 [Proteobacteria bacterium]|nr:hypothetical protein [Pseudomonadota bacterium]